MRTTWNEYTGELFHDQRPETYGGEFNPEGGLILKDEVKATLEKVKAGKAVGSDKNCIEMLDVLGELTLYELTLLFNTIYVTGNMVSSMCDSIFVTIPKIEGILEGNKHCTLKIMNYIKKLL